LAGVRASPPGAVVVGGDAGEVGVLEGGRRGPGHGGLHSTTAWLPAVVVGVASALVGLEFLPLPVAEHQHQVPWLHSSGPLALGTTAAILLPAGLLTGVPFTLQMAELALIMTGSVLVPVRPIDGGWVASHRAATIASLALLPIGVILLVV